MTALNQIYKCNICGNIVEVLHAGQGTLICCGQPMELQQEKNKDEGLEKHVPIIEDLPSTSCEVKDGVKIKIGSVEHPMEDNHYIEWIEVIAQDGKIGKKFLKPGDKPESDFYTRKQVVGARAYCNIHGLWKSN